MRKFRNVLIGLLCVAAVVALIVLLDGAPESFRAKYEGADLTTDVTGIGRTDTYDGYLRAHEDAPAVSEAVLVDVAAFEGDATLEKDDEGNEFVYTPDNSYVTWKVDVKESGMYNVRIDFMAAESRGVDVEREFHINGELPFSGASQLTFNRLWTDASEVKQDNQGNDIRPSQKEVFAWQKAFFKDDMGYQIEPYKFYFEKGENTISLKAINEPMKIRALELLPVNEQITYAEYIKLQPEVNMTEEAKKWSTIIQGEDAYLRSSPSLYARYDRSSPDTEPYSVKNTILNYIGGDPWRTAGQWIEWEFEVPEDGYYAVSVKARQAYQRGAVSARSLYIDGEIPFEEATEISFDYDTSWDLYTLSDAEGDAFKFYLEKGKHTIRLEATLGDMGTILSQMEESIYRLNLIYRKILVLTGVNPDRFRDYNLAKVYPEVIEAMDLESKRLYKLVDDTVAITGQKSDRVAVAQTLANQLEKFVQYNERITKQFANFKDNITSLGTAMQNMSECKLDIDMIIVSGENAKLPKVRDGFLAKAVHEVRSCATSYFVDYNSLGDKYEEGDDEDLIEVWIVTGRDQSTVLKTMIDDTFTPMTGIKVNVKLVIADTLLTAVVAGNGPDVVLSLGSWFPVNYAMRNAAEDLTQFEDFEEVIKPFYESAILPAEYNGGIYALPETQEYSVLFYRKDVLEELELTPPDTWDDMIALLPTVQGNNMSVGISYPDIATVDLSILNSLIYQNGGRIYDDDGKKTLIDEESGVTAFKLYTSLYNDYGLPTVFDFVSRFRSGEMPIGIANYSVYNTLVVSAPEIRNLWDFALFPGTLRTDENGNSYIDRSVHSQGLSCMMIATEDETIKKNSWEFMKWWVSADAQVRFGREIESILGSSARYTTANRDALKQLAWSSDQLKVLEEQMATTVGFREIAGGYSTTRHMTNAIRRVINTKEDARETLITYARTINEEIRIKRKEFGLPLE
ncbi:MAG: extracellular solute-binding protein [Clostridia bacterium]|nr:extracellular solute-binding protein [Clostridia bacterium]